jgi:hypothetical protein
MSVHAKLLALLREKLAADKHPLNKHVDGFSDQQVYHKLFHSFRGTSDTPKGLRLTWLGLTLLSLYFRGYPLTVPKDYTLGTLDLLYLDNRAKMPYYIGHGEGEEGETIFVVFEAKLGILIKLADGMISNLRDMES